MTAKKRVTGVAVVHESTMWLIHVFYNNKPTDTVSGFSEVAKAKRYANDRYPIGSFYEVDPVGYEDRRWVAQPVWQTGSIT